MKQENMIKLAPQDGFLLVNALRYARPRSQITLDDTCYIIVSHWHELSSRTRQTIARDVALEVELRHADSQEAKEYRRRETPNWERLLDLAEQEINNDTNR